MHEGLRGIQGHATLDWHTTCWKGHSLLRSRVPERHLGVVLGRGGQVAHPMLGLRRVDRPRSLPGHGHGHSVWGCSHALVLRYTLGCLVLAWHGRLVRVTGRRVGKALRWLL